MPHRKSRAALRRQRQISALKGHTHDLPGSYPIPPKVLAECLHGLYGQAIYPGEAEYEEARSAFNAAYPASPQLIVICLCVSDVRAGLKLARDHGLRVAARSGGHSMAGYSGCDGVVLDLSEMNSVVVDPETGTVIAGPGTQFERLNANLESFGLHLPGGGCSTVCVGGYLQGGGYGFTSRLFGMNSDNVLSFRTVLADGTLVTATPTRNPDLFWAVRGGTGNQFGIVVEVTYRLREVAEVWGVRLDWSTATHLDGAATALEAIQNQYIVGDRRPDLGFQLLLGIDPNYGKELRVAFLAMYPGDEAGLDAALEPLASIPGCREITRLRDRYSRVNDALLEGIPALPGNTGPPPPGKPSAKGSTYSRYIARPLSHDDWRAILTRLRTAPNSLTTAAMEAYGGQINRVKVTDSAFIHRDVIFDFFVDVFWMDDKDREANLRWHQEFIAFLDQYGNGHSYQNYPCAYQQDWRWAYFGPYLPTLLWIKEKYDPTHLFGFAQAITPEPADAPAHDYAGLLFSDRTIVRDRY